MLGFMEDRERQREKAMTGIELVRKFFPEATDAECDFILWEKTGFPSFFDPDIGAEEHFSRQLEKYRVAVKLGYDVCAACGMIKHDVKLITCGDCDAKSQAKSTG